MGRSRLGWTMICVPGNGPEECDSQLVGTLNRRWGLEGPPRKKHKSDFKKWRDFLNWELKRACDSGLYGSWLFGDEDAYKKHFYLVPGN